MVCFSRHSREVRLRIRFWVWLALAGCVDGGQPPEVVETTTATTTSDTTVTTPTTQTTTSCVVSPPPPEYELISWDRIANYTPLAPDECLNPSTAVSVCHRYGPALGDLDGDGRMEVLWSGYADGDRVYPIDEIVPAQGNEPATLVPNPGLSSLAEIVAESPGMDGLLELMQVGLTGIVDLDGDGDQDIVLNAPWGTVGLMGFLNNQGVFTPMLMPAVLGVNGHHGPSAADLFDWDNDGNLDLSYQMSGPVSPDPSMALWSTNILLQDPDGGYQSAFWLVNDAVDAMRQVDQLGVVDVDGARFLLAAGNPGNAPNLHHPMLYSFDFDVDPEGFPVATVIDSATPSASDGTQMGGSIVQVIEADEDGVHWSSLLLRSVDDATLLVDKPLWDGLWIDATSEYGLPVSPNNYQGITGSFVHDNQLPWHFTQLDSHTFAVANGDDAGSWQHQDGQPIRPDFYMGRDQNIDFYQLDSTGRYTSITDQVVLDGVAGVAGQPGGSYLGFYERSGYAVWLASWIDEDNIEGKVLRSWLAQRVHPDGHHWATFSPVGTTSNVPAIGTEVFFTTDPACGDALQTLLVDERPYPELAGACGACGYTRMVVGEHDVGNVLTSPEVEFYMGPDVNGAPPVGTALLRYPSGTVQRVDEVAPGWNVPVEPETVQTTPNAQGTLITYQPRDVAGQPVPLTAFTPDQVEIWGVPVSFTASLSPAGVAEIIVIAPTVEDLAAWTVLHPNNTASTQVRIEGTQHRPRLFWP